MTCAKHVEQTTNEHYFNKLTTTLRWAKSIALFIFLRVGIYYNPYVLL